MSCIIFRKGESPEFGSDDMVMDYRDYDEKIKQAKDALLAYKDRQHTIQGDLAGRAAGYVSAWAKTMIEKAIAKNPNQIVELGPETIGRMKRDLREAQELMPKFIGEQLAYLPWPQEAELPEDGELDDHISIRSSRLIDEMQIIVRVAIGFVGGILYEYGFQDDQANTVWKKNTWGDYLFSIALPVEEHAFPGASDWAGIKSALDRLAFGYTDLLRNYVGAINAKKFAQARDIWDNA
jgi:hypothetical protein